MSSIKRSLNIRQALIQILVFGAFSVGIYRFVENRLRNEFDRSLETIANAGTGTVEIEWSRKRQRIKVEVEDDHAPAYDRKSVIFAIRDPSGKVRLNPDKTNFKSWSLPEVPDNGFQLGETTFPDGRPARYRVQRFMPEIEGKVDYQDGEWSVTVVRERSSIDEALEIILYGCLGLGTLATLLTLGASYWSVRQGLRPLEKIGEEVTALKAHHLDHRFASQSLPQELQPIASKLNELLERMQAAFERERRFTSNAAHELRTPLAELQAILQLGEKWRPEDLASDNPTQYFSDGSEVSQRMSRLLETLFALSRETPESLDTEKTSFCLTTTLREIASAHPNHERIVIEGAPEITISANQDLLVAVFKNLLTNAVHHSTGVITITFCEQKTSASFSVRNFAPDLTTEDLAHLREPFWRKEKSRTNQDHLGLGLNLVENFCRSQDWKLNLNLDDEGVFSASILQIDKSVDPPHQNSPAQISSRSTQSVPTLDPKPAT